MSVRSRIWRSSTSVRLRRMPMRRMRRRDPDGCACACCRLGAWVVAIMPFGLPGVTDARRRCSIYAEIRNDSASSERVLLHGGHDQRQEVLLQGLPLVVDRLVGD